ncbi:P-loop containing nucleoside triphosphate hydrolase protein [Rhizoctonia solani]|nr:P-loop containing nucleoside triphosphate hydrolase protein [Rhizoctonia solani]
MPLCGSSSASVGGFAKKPIQRKIVVCGDGGCGKTSLLNVFTRGFFTQIYEPTVFENYVQDVKVDDQMVELSLWDTAGQEDFDRLRSLSYADTHLVMLCFSVDNPISLENVESKWIEEVLEHCPGVKIVLVALKCDLRDDHVVRDRLSRFGSRPVIYEEGLAVARRIRASRYLECSSKYNRGVTEVFNESARVSISRPKAQAPSSHSGCVVM